jgi:LysM repeat protein
LLLLLVSLLAACSSADSSPAPTEIPFQQASATPTPAPLHFPLPTSASLMLITPTPALAPVTPAIPSPTPATYTIKSGDTLGQIAQRYGLTLDDLFAANPGINTQILSIGQQIQIPARSTNPAASPPLPAQVELGPVRCIASGAGMWCLAEARNPHEQPLENVIAQISLFSSQGQLLESREALLPLNILPPAARLPLSAFFPNRPGESFAAQLELASAFLLAPGDPRYLPAITDNTLVQISADGLSAQVNGRILLSTENPPATQIWLTGLAYNKNGELIGFRRWQSSENLPPGESHPFALHLYSLDGFIEKVEIVVEARP